MNVLLHSETMGDNTITSNEGLIALINLPKQSRVGLDGHAIVLQSDDFVGIHDVPSSAFHLVTAAANTGTKGDNRNNHISITVGFIIHSEDPVRLIRRYDPQTEEVSDQQVDDLTARNLMEQVEKGQLPPTRILKYEQVAIQKSGLNQENSWRQQTQYIRDSNILQLRGLSSGDKIVPGSFDADGESITNTTAAFSSQTMDGKSVDYPPVPVIDTRLSLTTHKHKGAQRYLAKMTPARRTQLFVQSDEQLQHTILQQMLTEHYQNSFNALLGDLQLSFCLFLYLHCLSSLEHWKDLVAMLALSSGTCGSRYAELYQGLLRLLPYQLSSMDSGFLEDIDETGGNFLLLSLERLQRNLCWGHDIVADSIIITKFQHALVSKFPQTFFESSLRIQMLPNGAEEGADMYEDFNECEDGPVVVSPEDIEASMTRASTDLSRAQSKIPLEVRKDYPLLVAAIQSHEDILMTCARALDEKTDVSLVREAAAYLEDVEQHRVRKL
jgi:A1 cistron-splicing factor AAR2